QAITGVLQTGTGVLQAGTAVVQVIQSSAENKAKLRNDFSLMKERMARLLTIRDGVKKKFQKYWFPGNRIVSWLDEVEMINGQVEELTAKFSNIEEAIKIHIPQYDLIQKIGIEYANINRVIQEGKECEEALVKRGANRIVELDALISIKHIPALEKKLDQLLEYLKYDGYNSIKVHGEKGTGKSVLIQHLNNRLANAKKMFDIVIWLPSSKFRNNKYSSIEVAIQHMVAERLGLDILGIEDVNVVASKLRTELDGATYLLLFDDVMEAIKLEAVGIPTNTKGSKIVYATSKSASPFGQLFFSIKLERLSEGDSWQLFENIWNAENDKKVKGEIQTIARKIVKWCDGYFSLIKIVAKLFKSETSHARWSNGLKILRKPAKRGDIYMQALENFWHLSYDVLDKNQKNCFLFSVLYPEEYKIPTDCLFDCWAAHNLLENEVIGEDILDCLLEMALLNESSNKQYVTISKLCRGAAMKILQKDCEFKCLVVEKTSENVQNYSWEDRHWISLADSGIEVLPKKMKELIVLDLYKARFEFVLPMTNLKKLKVLYVNGCAVLKKLPFEIEGHDNMLEVLDIRGCIINEIPQDFKRLEHLRRLMVSVKEGDTQNRFIISELSSLKELIIDVKSNALHNDGDSYMTWCDEVIERIIEKVETLDKLTTFKFCFKYDTIDVIQLSGDTLRIFVPKQGSLQHIWNKRNIHNSTLQIYIGFRMTPNLEIPDYFYKYDSFVLSCEKIVIEPVIKEVLLKVNALITLNDNSMEHLDQTVVPYIEHCLVQRCNKIETLMLTHGFLNLKTLVLSQCSQLKVLFSNGASQQVMCIEHLEIRDCPAIEKINMLSASGGDILPKLTTFVLHDLRMLTEICPGLEWPSLITMEIHECPLLTKIPLSLNNANNLLHIKVEKEWWSNLQLDHEIKQNGLPYSQEAKYNVVDMSVCLKDIAASIFLVVHGNYFG
ncbi:hypothetical protein M8C21_030523, partial [Ambrosia artemisiifolia]